jgi:hypothetical protein
MDQGTQHKDKLTIGNAVIDVDVTQSYKDGVVTESIQTHGEEVDREEYKLDDSGLSVIKASDDTFDPPMPLFRFPVTGEQDLNWSGSLHEGPSNRQASAKVHVQPQEIHFSDHDESGAKIEVQLSIDSGTPIPASRTFSFWITNHGIAKRAFGAGTARSLAGVGG